MGAIIYDLTLDEIESSTPPGAAPSWIAPHPAGLQVVGDEGGYRETFVARRDHHLLVANKLSDLLPALRTSGEPAVIDPFGVTHVVDTGFVPLPHTEFRDVYRVTSGDSVVANAANGKVHVEVESDYPWMRSKSRGDESPSTERLHQLIVASTERQLDSCGGNGLLMMSSGKDSVALAVALADAGRAIPCFTFKSSPADNEHLAAAEFCKKLGLDHATIEMPRDPMVVRRNLTSFFENAPAPSGDHAAIPMIVAVAASGVDSGGIIDGGGNDAYMGYVAGKAKRFKQRYRIRNRRLADLVGRAVRVDSPVNYLARSIAAATLPGRSLRYHETSRFYSDAIDSDDYWYELSEDLKGRNLMDVMTLGLIRQTEGARSNLKVRLIAESLGMAPLLPFCDRELASYYFHLPASGRFDEESRTNKLLLRQLLKEKVGYDPAVVGEGHFSFDGIAFLDNNADFVREEILSCELWEPEIEPMVGGWLATIHRRPFIWHVLIPLFMVSGWYNHSRFLERSG